MVRQTKHFAAKHSSTRHTEADVQMKEVFEAAHRVIPGLVDDLQRIAGTTSVSDGKHRQAFRSPGQSFDLLPAVRQAQTPEPTPDRVPSAVQPDAKNQLATGSKVIMAMATVLFMTGVGIAFTGFRTNQDVKAQVKSVSTQKVASDSEGGMQPDSLPDEVNEPPSVTDYKTAASYPRVIRIAKTGTEARTLPLALMANGAMKAPGNIYDAGWYKDSSKPGEAGAMVIDGHVSGPTKPGVFKKLGSLVTGDTIEIERGDGQKFTYTVTKVSLVDADKFDMSDVLVPSVPGKEGLNLITCGGKYNKTTGHYEQRTVVYAVR